MVKDLHCFSVPCSSADDKSRLDITAFDSNVASHNEVTAVGEYYSDVPQIQSDVVSEVKSENISSLSVTEGGNAEGVESDVVVGSDHLKRVPDKENVNVKRMKSHPDDLINEDVHSYSDENELSESERNAGKLESIVDSNKSGIDDKDARYIDKSNFARAESNKEKEIKDMSLHLSPLTSDDSITPTENVNTLEMDNCILSVEHPSITENENTEYAAISEKEAVVPLAEGASITENKNTEYATISEKKSVEPLAEDDNISEKENVPHNKYDTVSEKETALQLAENSLTSPVKTNSNILNDEDEGYDEKFDDYCLTPTNVVEEVCYLF